jgi:hypothetical protein
MSYVVKGYLGVTQVKRAPVYNAETKIRTFVTEYQGTESAVRGLEGQLTLQGLSYRTDHNGPVWSLFVDDPVQESIGDELDRWEIFTESTEKSLFELPDAVDEALLYNAGVLTGNSSYRSVVESAVETRDDVIESFTWPIAKLIVHHLRFGVTGWQLDLVGIRRTRRLLSYSANNYRMNLDGGLLIYSNGQLGVPSSVAFGLPLTPPNISTLFTWGWRKRSQRVEIVGSFVEQTVELLLAPWSTSLAYQIASSNLDWQ